ncbi:hypothetical protein [uncultured Oceanisphaera sp.]|uniref:hypothetical protein n=1 Tax=uncultured Oceanisphaera sp. TaxID=353858 RepID=UPI0026046A79|nr:hypothetical protein [uncultured Oceanisphaera sp.]
MKISNFATAQKTAMTLPEYKSTSTCRCFIIFIKSDSAGKNNGIDALPFEKEQSLTTKVDPPNQ